MYLLQQIFEAFELLAFLNALDLVKKFGCLHSLLLSCPQSVDLTQSLEEISSIIELYRLFLEIIPVIFSLRLQVEGYNNPLKQLIRL